MKVYVYPKCSTCKKALNWLNERDVAYEMVDIKTDNPSKEQLKAWYDMSGLPLKRFFNTSGIAYRQMELAKKLATMTEEEMLELLATDGMLVKRPLVIGDGFVLTGFRQEQWAEKIK